MEWRAFEGVRVVARASWQGARATDAKFPDALAAGSPTTATWLRPWCRFDASG